TPALAEAGIMDRRSDCLGGDSRAGIRFRPTARRAGHELASARSSIAAPLAANASDSRPAASGWVTVEPTIARPPRPPREVARLARRVRERGRRYKTA